MRRFGVAGVAGLVVGWLLVVAPGVARARAVVTPVEIGSNAAAGLVPTALSVTTTQAVPAGASIVVTALASTLFGSQASSAVCSDSAGNSYYTDVSENAGVDLTVVCSAPVIASQLAAGSTITVTFTGVDPDAQDYLVHAFSVSGLAASPLDQTAAAAGTGGSASSGATATTTQANELLFGAFEDTGATASTAGFVAGNNATANDCAATGTPTSSSLGGIDDGNSPSLFGIYCVVSATGAYAAQASLTGNPFWQAVIATYKLALTASGTALGSSQNPSPFGQSVTFTATVTGDSPTGTINFEDGGTTISGCGAANIERRHRDLYQSALSTGSRTASRPSMAATQTDQTSTSSTCSTSDGDDCSRARRPRFPLRPVTVRRRSVSRLRRRTAARRSPAIP